MKHIICKGISIVNFQEVEHTTIDLVKYLQSKPNKTKTYNICGDTKVIEYKTKLIEIKKKAA